MSITAPPTAAPIFRMHCADGTRAPFWTVDDAQRVATAYAALTSDVVAVETLAPSGAWVLVELIGTRS